jgi:hypothetical protein
LESTKVKLNKLVKESKGISPEILEGLMKLSNNPDVQYLFAAVRCLKQTIMFDHFGFPASDPVKNALHKEFSKGGDYYLTTLCNLIKQSGLILEKLEEKDESNK